MSSMASSMAGGMFQAAGSLIQGKQTANSLKYQAQVQTNNANEALTAASLNANRNSLMATKMIGQASAAYGASGVSGDSGSVLSVLGASAANAELDKQNILYGGQIRSINSMNQAHMDDIGATNAVNASYFNAFAGMTGGMSSAVMNNSGGAPSVNGDSAASAAGQAEVAGVGTDFEPTSEEVPAGMDALDTVA